ncbi:uncharacterized protein TA06775 [Theileria annulata]|uniref:Uncharacterized protein n=1 Tax=Theileria annulata TaxID=5874 RepID=Q4UHS6_THEAN|nr:uncharacterized protein TA06775 [Theileria annulata]CAI73363.1 hypothetical protein, conserved [Theileria annulata]|eukprot:XP_954040.1 hypothetical protein, conserved [Theileria annulata]
MKILNFLSILYFFIANCLCRMDDKSGGLLGKMYQKVPHFMESTRKRNYDRNKHSAVRNRRSRLNEEDTGTDEMNSKKYGNDFKNYKFMSTMNNFRDKQGEALTLDNFSSDFNNFFQTNHRTYASYIKRNENDATCPFSVGAPGQVGQSCKFNDPSGTYSSTTLDGSQGSCPLKQDSQTSASVVTPANQWPDHKTFDQSNAEQEKAHEELKSEVDQVKQEQKNLEEKVNEANAAEQALKATAEDLKEGQEELKQEQDNLDQAQDKLESTQKEVEAKEHNLEQTADALKSEANKLEEEKESLDEQKEELENQQNDLNKQKNELESEKKNLDKEKEDLTTGQKSLDTEKESLDNEKKDLEQQQKSLDDQQSKLEDQQDKLNDQQEKLEEAQKASANEDTEASSKLEKTNENNAQADGLKNLQPVASPLVNGSPEGVVSPKTLVDNSSVPSCDNSTEEVDKAYEVLLTTQLSILTITTSQGEVQQPTADTTNASTSEDNTNNNAAESEKTTEESEPQTASKSEEAKENTESDDKTSKVESSEPNESEEHEDQNEENEKDEYEEDESEQNEDEESESKSTTKSSQKDNKNENEPATAEELEEVNDEV